MSLPFFLSGVGPVIADEAAIKLRRVVWLSGIFLEQHSTLGHIVLMMMSKVVMLTLMLIFTIASDEDIVVVNAETDGVGNDEGGGGDADDRH